MGAIWLKYSIFVSLMAIIAAQGVLEHFIRPNGDKVGIPLNEVHEHWLSFTEKARTP
jgi:hypothetical protein